MKIEIKLKDPESCEGCPLFVFDCVMEKGSECVIYTDHSVGTHEEPKRPKQCKEENGL